MENYDLKGVIVEGNKAVIAVVIPALSRNNFTTKQYRFNPFVGISFRLDNNRFK